MIQDVLWVYEKDSFTGNNINRYSYQITIIKQSVNLRNSCK